MKPILDRLKYKLVWYFQGVYANFFNEQQLLQQVRYTSDKVV